jgi:nitroreductase
MTELPLDVMDAIYSTRAVRYLKPDVVEEAVIWCLLDAAIRGPSSGNGQRWAWIVITDPETKRTIGEWYLQEWTRLLEKSWRRRLWDLLTGHLRGQDANARREPPSDANFRAGEHLAHHIAEAPVWIIPVLRNAGRESTLAGADIAGGEKTRARQHHHDAPFAARSGRAPSARAAEELPDDGVDSARISRARVVFDAPASSRGIRHALGAMGQRQSSRRVGSRRVGRGAAGGPMTQMAMPPVRRDVRICYVVVHPGGSQQGSGVRRGGPDQAGEATRLPSTPYSPRKKTSGLVSPFEQ